MNSLRQKMIEAVSEVVPTWIELSDRIHANPEYNYQEFKASRWLCEEFAKLGFSAELGVGSVETAFRAVYDSGRPGPSVGIIIEYDALEGLGHACAHNTKGPAVLCACNVLLRVLADKINGKIVAYGCPAEEGGGGKVRMVDGGLFRDLDLCLELGVGPTFSSGLRVYACQGLEITFTGRAAHAGYRNNNGINALEALLFVLGNIGYLRERLGERGLIHAVVLEGGKVPGSVPNRARAKMNVRSLTGDLAVEYAGYIETLCKVAAGASGAKVDVNKGLVYQDYIKCPTLTHWVMDRIKESGFDPEFRLAHPRGGSTDVGNVSQIVPTETIGIGIGKHLTAHTDEYRIASGGEPGHSAVINGGKVLAACLFDLLATDSSELVNKAKSEFEEAKKNRDLAP